MNESNELLLAIEQLKRSNRRWKTLAHTVSIVLVSVAFFLMIGAQRERMRAEAAMQQLAMAMADEQRAASQAQQR